MSLYPRKGTKYLWCKFEVAGRQIRRSTGQVDRRAAAKEERRLRAYFESRAPKRGAKGSVGLADLAGMDCEGIKSRGRSEKHVVDTMKLWENVAAHFGANRDPRSVTYDDIVAYITARRGAGLRGQSIVREVQCLRRGFAIAHRRGWLPELPAEWPSPGVDPPDEEQAGQLHEPEILLAWIEELSGDARDQAEVVLLTGLRREEDERVCARWIEEAPAQVGTPALLRVPHAATKSKKPRVIGLVPRVLAILERRAAAVKAATLPCSKVPWDLRPLFGKADHKTAFELARKRIGYDQRISLRDLRHCYATWAAQGTGDVAAAQSALGHSQITTTQKYMHSTIKRTAAASVAAADILEGNRHSEVGTDEVSCESVGRILEENHGAKNRDRTDDLLITNQAPAMAAHLTGCFSCALDVSRWLLMQANGNQSRHSEPAQVVELRPRKAGGGA